MTALGWIAAGLLGCTFAVSLWVWLDVHIEPVDLGEAPDSLDEHFEAVQEITSEVLAIYNLEQSLRLPDYIRPPS